MKKTIFFLLFCTTVFLGGNKVDACSCVPSPAPSEALEKASAVFAGEVLKIEGHPLAGVYSSADPLKITFDVEKYWKGPLSKNFTVTTALDSASCGYSFETGQEYVVYTYFQKDSEGYFGGEAPFQVSLCSRTALLSDATEDLAALPQSQVPAPESLPEFSKRKPSAWWSLGGVAILLGAVYVMHKRF